MKLSSILIAFALACPVLAHTSLAAAQDAPAAPEAPEVPDAPAAPEAPEVETPDADDAPAVPETPDAPDVPTTPDAPETPETPDVPEAPATPDAPATDGPAAPAAPTSPVSEPEPELAAPAPEGPAAALDDTGDAVEEAAEEIADETDAVTSEVDQDLADAAEEVGGEAAAAAAGGEDGAGGEAPDTSDRLASANPVVEGVQWSMPITLNTSLTTRTLTGRGLTYDPTFSWGLSFAPRWQFKKVKGMSFGGLFSLNQELTESNGLTARERQMTFNNLRFDLTYGLPWKPGGISFTPSIRVSLPTSVNARGGGNIVSPSISLLAIKAFPVANGLIFGAQGVWGSWIQHDANLYRGAAGLGPNNTRSECALADGREAEICPNGSLWQHQAAGVLFVTFLPIPRLAFSASLVAQWWRSPWLSDVDLNELDGVYRNPENGTLEDNSRNNHWTTFTSFTMSVSYDFLPYLTGSFSYSTLAIFPDSDGGREQIFLNENSTIGVSLQFRPAGFYGARRAAREAAAEEAAEAAGN